jgi:Xaa-Pro aminopeptidase
MYPSLQIPQSEYESRATRLSEYVKSQALSGIVLFDNFHILYFTGFNFIPTERPIAFAMTASGEGVLYVPRLEIPIPNTRVAHTQWSSSPTFSVASG